MNKIILVHKNSKGETIIWALPIYYSLFDFKRLFYSSKKILKLLQEALYENHTGHQIHWC